MFKEEMQQLNKCNVTVKPLKKKKSFQPEKLKKSCQSQFEGIKIFLHVYDWWSRSVLYDKNALNKSYRLVLARNSWLINVG